MPETLGLSKNGHWLSLMCTNLLIAAYYKKQEFVDHCTDKLESSLKRKDSLYYKSILNCLADIFSADPDAFDKDLASVCKGWQQIRLVYIQPIDRTISLDEEKMELYYGKLIQTELEEQLFLYCVVNF